jgi:hypothetical protein
MHGFRARALLPIGAVMLLAACSGSGSPTATTAGGGTGGGGGTAGPGATGQSGGGSGLGSIKACSLLTAAEIQSAIGIAMNTGLEQDTDGQVECNWDPLDTTEPSGVSVSVATYDDVIWQTFSQAKSATPVSGLGDAAFSGYPGAGSMMIKKGGYMIQIGVVDFSADQAKVSAAGSTFAKLVLGRL